MSDAADTIWLQDPDGAGAVSFCDHQVNRDDHEYVRKDRIPDPLYDPRVKALVEAAQYMVIQAEWCESKEGVFWEATDLMRTALAAMKGGGV